jgi:hypothetical protein
MKRLWMIPAFAIIALASGSKTASAAYCGAISYQGCCGGGVVTEGAASGGVVSEGAVVEGAVVEGAVVDGAASGAAISGDASSAGSSYTVMRTVRERVYEQQQQTRYRTRYETYYEDQVVSRTRMVPETTAREVQYTVMVLAPNSGPAKSITPS